MATRRILDAANRLHVDCCEAMAAETTHWAVRHRSSGGTSIGKFNVDVTCSARGKGKIGHECITLG